MNDQKPVLHNPKAKASQPQGQLAAMLTSRGAWDDFGQPGNEINRASSAPPSQLQLKNNVSFTWFALIRMS